MTEVASAPAVASTPSVIGRLLGDLAIDYREVPDHPALDPARKVQAVLLDDSVGILMVLFTQSHLLDLNRLADLIGRRMTALAPDRLQTLLDKQGLSLLPGLPALINSPCLYEEQLLQQSTLLISAGEPGQLLEITREDFKRLLKNASVGGFGEPLSAIKLDYAGDDGEAITRAVQAFTARRIQQRLEATIELPPLAESVRRIMRLRSDPEVTIDEITSVVETDPALAAQVMSWASSSYYASQSKIRSVEDAIVRVLGVDLVINLALSLSLGKSLSLPKDNPQSSTPYWQQSIYTAAVIEGLTRAMPREQRPEVGMTYLGGLLHNFGYLLLAYVFPPHFSLICRHLEVNPHVSHSLIEQHLLGISREQMGAWLMRFWGMPDELAIAVRFQHDPAYIGTDAAYPNLVCLALGLLRNHGIGHGASAPIPDALFERLGVTRDKAEAVVSKVLEAEVLLREMAAQFGQA
ncbi:aminoacyl-tRNA deacylase and HDOD domain-containing protein [Pseudomonas psychrophila]|uniref:HD-like signal output (HDOD) domain, no enzymatic activity n=1 Tax=Pseudomonas psychrophila TaxID=122355 RepID=A0ABY0VHA5_9PSED|nr:HDOD domain-containing protein [Pseudomonas psychrophila]KAB0484388.1 HDOD domain-containing protein [Pseudomonas psychrophila]KMM96298.1 histidine kinase [Pseudomonas psychrophila]QIE31422.1 HDOD domain-containing protein [Pseudomonas psychrophila]WVI97966.1 HDOD domain-containing protein [Pseudomonas psychrophila]SDU25008.1 HD-like signal output (HDOD) domain, no enzymatic activity [Pseudomonas psychrophila]